MLDQARNRTITLGSNCSEFPNSCLGLELAFVEDVAKVLADRGHSDLIQLGELLLGEPDRSLVQTNWGASSMAVLNREPGNKSGDATW
jgi:hypothetical protein